MKNWNEAIEGMIVYTVNGIEIFDDETLIGNTKPFQKAIIQEIDKEYVMIIIDGGKFDGYDFYFYYNQETPSELLTAKEFKELKMTELKVWKDLKKFISVIDKLNEKSDDILIVRELIEKHNK